MQVILAMSSSVMREVLIAEPGMKAIKVGARTIYLFWQEMHTKGWAQKTYKLLFSFSGRRIRNGLLSILLRSLPHKAPPLTPEVVLEVVHVQTSQVE
jgi:hypothetical protein